MVVPLSNLKAIIFGSGGQDGYYLRLLLQQKNVTVINISRSKSDFSGDVSDFDFVNIRIQEIKPDYVFSFAANSTTHHQALFENHESISTGSLNILESVRLHCPDAIVFLTGSAMQFENIGLPINESTPFEASSPYSVSRIHSVYAGRYYREKFGLKVYIGYFFNHDSPLRSEQHINQKIVKAALRIAEGSSEVLEIGNISIQKEFAFAGDIVAGVWTLVNQQSIFEAVIGTGITYPLQEWVEICFSKLGLKWQDHIVLQNNFIAEYDILGSDPALIRSIGWEWKADIYDLADMMIYNSNTFSHTFN